MTFISYAQNFEDIMLWRALKHVKNGFYIDVGAHHPTLFSITKSFYELGWHGINIEPVSEWFEKLVQERPRDINLQLAVGNKHGELPLYEIPGTGLSTLNKSIADKHVKEQGYQIIDKKVPVRTLEEICLQHYAGPVHFLNIDVEGAEKEVLEGMNFKKIRPWIIVLESTLPTTQIDNCEEWESILISADYVHAYFDGLNRFYVSREQKEIKKSFQVPPNCFDDCAVSETQPFGLHLGAKLQQLQTALSEQQAHSQSLQSECDAEKARLAAANRKVEDIQAQLGENNNALANSLTALSRQENLANMLQNELDASREQLEQAIRKLDDLRQRVNQPKE